MDPLPPPVTVAVMPKSTRNRYFEDCEKGAQEAARDLGFTLRWDGPTDSNATRQVQIVRAWVREGLKVIAVSVESRSLLSPVLEEARTKGVKVITWDSDAEQDARDFTVVQATPDAIAQALAFEVGRMLGGRGALAGITSSLTASNQNAWIDRFKARLAADYPEIELLAVRPCDDVEENAREEARQLLTTYPNLRAIVGFCSPAVPGAAQAVKQSGRKDVRVTGVSLPELCREFIVAGVVDSVVIWSTRQLGYLAAASAHALAKGILQPGNVTLKAGKLGNVIVRGDEIRLGRCHIISKGNIDKFAD